MFFECVLGCILCVSTLVNWIKVNEQSHDVHLVSIPLCPSQQQYDCQNNT